MNESEGRGGSRVICLTYSGFPHSAGALDSQGDSMKKERLWHSKPEERIQNSLSFVNEPHHILSSERTFPHI